MYHNTEFLFRGLYGIADTCYFKDTDTLLAKSTQAIKNGMQLLQYRNKAYLPGMTHVMKEVEVLLALCHRYDVPLLINDHIDLAVQCKADGVHIGQKDAALPDVRVLLGPQALIGVTCHNMVSAAVLAEQQSADYVSFGAFYPSKTKEHARKASITVLSEARHVCSLPFVAIGGISPENGHVLVEAGADMLAVAHALFNSERVDQAAQAFSSCFK